MKRSIESGGEKIPAKFEEGNFIICPSDVSGVVWKVDKVQADGSIVAIVKAGQRYPSQHYPRQPLEITLEAQSLWKKTE